MISKKNLKEYEFNTMDDYYNYVIESHVNGQFAQVKKLLFDMSTKQNILFIQYCIDNNIDMPKYFFGV